MPYSFGDHLDLLYASYGRITNHDPDRVGDWTGIRERADRGELTYADWQVIRSMFQAVTHWGQKNGEEWFHAFSRWLGTANHSTKLPRAEGAVEDPFGDGGRITVASDVDPERLGVLLYVYGLTPMDSPMVEGLSRYLVLDPELRSHFTDEMLVIEQALAVIENLQESDVTAALKRKLHEPVLPSYLRLAFVDHKDLLFEHDSLPVLLYNTVLNSIWEGKAVNIYRVHINMTTLNEQDDTGELGNVYLRVVRGWFQEKFGSVHVVQNPERTTFEFVASSANFVRSVMSNYETEVRQRIETTPGVPRRVTHLFIPRAVISERTLSRENLYRYAIRTKGDVEAFGALIEFRNDRLTAVRLAGMIDEGGFDIGRALSLLKIDFDGIKAGAPALRKTLNALIIKATMGLNAELAAQTSFFEKEENGRASDASEGQPVFVEDDLPTEAEDRVRYQRWLGFRARRVGYVGPGQYNPARHNAELADAGLPANLFFAVGPGQDPRGIPEDDPQLSPLVNHILRIVPRLGHIKGRLSHARARSEGGFLEQFVGRLNRLANLPDEASGAMVALRLGELKEAARALVNEFRKFYALAVTDPRNAWTVKQHRLFALHRGDVTENFSSNFFVQEVALSGNRYLAALEYDSFRAFNEQYARHDDIDSDYHHVRDAIFLAARRMNMPMPIVNPSGGDHISISFSDKNRHGDSINPVSYCKLVQQIVREAFADRPFHDSHKVERQTDDGREIFRLPMWKKVGGREGDADLWHFGFEKPDGYEPFRRTLTVTMALGEHHPLRGLGDLSHFVTTEDEVSLALGEAKRRSWPDKEGFADIRTRPSRAPMTPAAGGGAGPQTDAVSLPRPPAPSGAIMPGVAGGAMVHRGQLALQLTPRREMPAQVLPSVHTLPFSHVVRGHSAGSAKVSSDTPVQVLARVALQKGLTGCGIFLARLTEEQALSLIRISGGRWREVLVRQGFSDEANRLAPISDSLQIGQKVALVLAAVAGSSTDVGGMTDKLIGSPTDVPGAQVFSNYTVATSPSVRTIPSFLVR